uniref:Uncharacterized protein n=1 Tax=Aquilaria malaccensis TaxID=223753 RepID=A0A4Y6GN23_9ROSI|nr:hypothetical protein [Aquilaria malaccensis]
MGKFARHIVHAYAIQGWTYMCFSNFVDPIGFFYKIFPININLFYINFNIVNVLFIYKIITPSVS